MQHFHTRFLIGAVAGLSIAACSGQVGPSGESPLPAPIAGATASTESIAANRVGRSSWIDHAAAKGRLLYVADPFANAVFVYTYPQLSGAGQISGFAGLGGVCTDRRGYVWILDINGVAAYEFAHGGSVPINVLHPAGDSTGNPGVGTGCAVNPKNGDLAVAGSGPGLTVFRNGQNTQTTYWDFSFQGLAYVGYDNAGNLFADGRLESSFAFGLAELAAGTSSLSNVTLSGGTPAGPGGIQWDGKYLDIADSGSGNLYQTNGSAILNTIVLSARCQGQFYIVSTHKRIVTPDPCNVAVDVYPYPGGGSAVKTAVGGLQDPTGVAISISGG